MSLIAPAGPHTARMWDVTAECRARIERLDFLTQLADGTLDPEKFTFYIQQDSHYLRAYQRAMTEVAGRAARGDDLAFWAASASEAVGEEQALHTQLMGDPLLAAHVDAPVPESLHTAAYSSFLLATAAFAPYAVAAAAVLPCYWIYAEAGARIAASAKAATLGQHPYATWVQAYADEDFHRAAARAVGIVERACEAAGQAERERAVEAFRAATRFEELFWVQPMDAPKDRLLI